MPYNMTFSTFSKCIGNECRPCIHSDTKSYERYLTQLKMKNLIEFNEDKISNPSLNNNQQEYYKNKKYYLRDFFKYYNWNYKS